MKETALVEFDDVKFHDGKPVVSSLDVAERFGKHHKHVLAAIQSVEISEEFNRSNFRPITYKDRRNRDQPAFLMTRDGFLMLTMPFTGKPAAEQREKVIVALNKAEEAFKNPTKFLECIPPKEKAEMLLKVLIDDLDQSEARADAAQAEMETLKNERRAIIDDSTNKVETEIDRRRRAEHERDVYKSAVERTAKVAYKILNETEEQLEIEHNDLLSRSAAENVTRLPAKIDPPGKPL